MRRLAICALAALVVGCSASLPYRAVGEVRDPETKEVIARVVTDGSDFMIEGSVEVRAAVENKDDNSETLGTSWAGGVSRAWRRTGGIFGRKFEKVEPADAKARLYPAGQPAPAPVSVQ